MLSRNWWTMNSFWGRRCRPHDPGHVRRGAVDGGGVGAPELLARHLPGAHGELRVEGDADVGLAQVRLPVAQRADEVVPARLHVQHQHPVDPRTAFRYDRTIASSWWVRYSPLGVGNGWATVAISSNIGITGWPGVA